jgi:hypothetical protein
LLCVALANPVAHTESINEVMGYADQGKVLGTSRGQAGPGLC